MNDFEKLVNTVFNYLFVKKDNTTSQSSLEDELDKLPPETRAIVERLEAKEILQESAAYSRFKKENDARRATVLRHIREQIGEDKSNNTIAFRRYLAAASAIVALGVCSFLFTPKLNNRHNSANQTAAHIIEPGSSRAVLTLSNGQVIQLDSIPGGIVINQGLHYADGRPIELSSVQPENMMATLQTPRGGEYVLTLSDGSRIHMNADSKLVYPITFHGKTREVTLDGEAFFEIASNKEKPFHVRTNNNEVVVLGTRFNIRSYQEETLSYITLVEGRVRLQDGHDNPELTPGMQGISDGMATRVRSVNVEDFINWKNGLFVFQNENLEAVAAKISRWYDIEIEIASSAKQVRIWGSLSKYDTFDKVLDILQLIDNDLIINIDGRRVQIMK